MLKFITDHPILCILAVIGFVIVAMAIFLYVITRQEAKRIDKARIENDNLSLSDHDWKSFRNY